MQMTATLQMSCFRVGVGVGVGGVWRRRARAARQRNATTRTACNKITCSMDATKFTQVAIWMLRGRGATGPLGR